MGVAPGTANAGEMLQCRLYPSLKQAPGKGSHPAACLLRVPAKAAAAQGADARKVQVGYRGQVQVDSVIIEVLSDGKPRLIGCRLIHLRSWGRLSGAQPGRKAGDAAPFLIHRQKKANALPGHPRECLGFPDHFPGLRRGFQVGSKIDQPAYGVALETPLKRRPGFCGVSAP